MLRGGRRRTSSLATTPWPGNLVHVRSGSAPCWGGAAAIADTVLLPGAGGPRYAVPVGPWSRSCSSFIPQHRLRACPHPADGVRARGARSSDRPRRRDRLRGDQTSRSDLRASQPRINGQLAGTSSAVVVQSVRDRPPGPGLIGPGGRAARRGPLTNRDAGRCWQTVSPGRPRGSSPCSARRRNGSRRAGTPREAADGRAAGARRHYNRRMIPVGAVGS